MDSIVQDVDWFALAPALAVALGALVLLLADLGLPARRYGLLRWLTLMVIVVAGGLVVAQIGEVRGTFCQIDRSALLVCSFVADPVTRAFQAIALIAAGLITLLPARAVTRHTGRLSGEYHFLLLSSLAGALALAGSRDLITIVVALEVLSLPAFAIVALPADREAADDRGAEAALKAFLFSVIALAVMLIGIALLYGATGTLHLDSLATALTVDPVSHSVAAVGAALTLGGLLFKVAAVPFHGWVPDAYAGAPVRVAAYLSTVSKIGGFAGLSVVLWYGLRPYGLTWGPALAVIAAATMTVGNLGALRQTQPVRLLAWSSIAQSGFMLVPLASAGATNATGEFSRDGASATLAYLAVYVVLNLGAFGVVALVSAGQSADEVPDLAAYRGLGRAAPLPAIALAFCLVGLAGLPPAVAGLVAKVVVFSSAVDAGLGWLAVVMAVNVVLGVAYYLRWTALLFAAPVGAGPVRPTVPAVAAVAVAVAALAGLALSIWPELTLQLL